MKHQKREMVTASVKRMLTAVSPRGIHKRAVTKRNGRVQGVTSAGEDSSSKNSRNTKSRRSKRRTRKHLFEIEVVGSKRRVWAAESRQERRRWVREKGKVYSFPLVTKG